MNRSFQFRIWGSRGSACQVKENKRKFGLNTTCISFETSKEFILIDAGTGIVDFDNYIYENNLTSKKVTILLTHYHFDHIMGLPFTKMIYDKDVKVEIYGNKFNDKSCREILSNIFGSPYYPVPLMDLENVYVYDLDNTIYEKFEGVHIDTINLNHKDGSIGYKIEFLDKVISIITDYEYATDTNNMLVRKFIENSSILLMDSFFAKGDYSIGWGHSTLEEVIMIVEHLNIGQTLLFHHNPKYDDDFLLSLENELNKKYGNIIFARDGMVFNF